MLTCCIANGTEWKVIDGVVEDWICIPKFGAHILWGNDMDEAQRTPLDYWDVISISNVSRHQHLDFELLASKTCKFNGKEEEILAVFGALYSQTRTSEGRRDLWSTEDAAPRFGE